MRVWTFFCHSYTIQFYESYFGWNISMLHFTVPKGSHDDCHALLSMPCFVKLQRFSLSLKRTDETTEQADVNFACFAAAWHRCWRSKFKGEGCKVLIGIKAVEDPYFRCWEVLKTVKIFLRRGINAYNAWSTCMLVSAKVLTLFDQSSHSIIPLFFALLTMCW